MKIGVLSDIHSNIFAFKSVLSEAAKHRVSSFIILGDIFGYYPWAKETYELLSSLNIFKIIKGNHDNLLIDKHIPKSMGKQYFYIKKNAVNLGLYLKHIKAMLKKMPYRDKFKLGRCDFIICHGTPDNPNDGRFYPDDKHGYKWFPKQNQIVILGNTHYPFIKHLKNGGMIINPGSVGQPRDGNVKSSWGILDSVTCRYQAYRTKYSQAEAISLLKKMKWKKEGILALQKNYQGKLVY